MAANSITSWKKPFFLFWSSQAFSLFGSALVQFALVWWLTKTTGSASVLAIASTLAVLPQIIISPFAGTLVDRMNRKWVIIISDSLIALATVLLAVIFYMGAIQIWHVYALMFIRAIGGAFHYPAEQSSISLMVPHDQLSRIAGLNQAMQGAISIIAPPLGALLLELLNVQSTLAIDFITAFFAVAILLGVHVPQPEKISGDKEFSAKSLFNDLKGGFSYIIQWKGLLYLIVLAMVMKIALSPAFSLLPLLVNKHFNGNAAQYGLSESVAGVGIVLGGLPLGIWGGFKKKIYTTSMGLAFLGVGFTWTSFLNSQQFSVFLPIMFMVGFMIPMIDGPIMAIMQSKVNPEYQGRVFTIMSSLVWLTTPIGLGIAGPVSDLLGIRIWYLIAGLLCIFVTLAAAFMPAIREIESNHLSQEKVASLSLK